MNKYTPSSDPVLVSKQFKSGQLCRAREINGYTKVDLSKKVGVTPSAISQYEAGTILPDPKVVLELGVHLGFPIEFFAYSPTIERIPVENCHFRSLRSATQTARRQSIRIGELAAELYMHLESEGFEFPSEKITALKSQLVEQNNIEDLALKFRTLIGLGAGPIHDPIALVEKLGIIVLPLHQDNKEVDAFSTWINGIPVMMISMNKSASRTHFDVAHELGHLIMHEDVSAGDSKVEKEADTFASAFLLPKISFVNECPRRWDIKQFSALKSRWRVSLKALVYKAKSMGYMSDYSNKYANIFINKHYGRHEPCEWELQKPSLLKEAIQIAEKEGISITQISQDIGVYPQLIRKFIA